MLRSVPRYPTLAVLMWLIAALTLVLFPHFFRVPLWLTGLYGAAVAWRYWATAHEQRLLNKNVLFIIGLMTLAGVVLSYGSLFGRDAGVALLVGLCGLKFMELESKRDALLLCFLGYFLIITNFLYAQDILTALYLIIVMIAMTATLNSLTDENFVLNTRQRLRLASVLVLQAIPLMLVLFILFPRISGPLWGLPKDSHRGVTGLSNLMTLGNISEMSLSDEIAFRVKFKDDKVPPPNALYWRGIVMWGTDGKQWRGGQFHNILTPPLGFEPLGEAVDYSVTLEPHEEEVLLALDLPANVNAEVRNRITLDYQVLSFYKIRNRTRYQIRSYPAYRADVTPQKPQHQQHQLNLLNAGLALPQNMHPKARALAMQWKNELQHPEAIVQYALRYFNQNPFRYTFTPELMLDDPIDQFLFETQAGFCEHYATAFVVLMRAAGIPARVVTGYLGGKVNPVDGYFVVRQRDAHAWAEVWLEGKGWTRVDPTAAVAPERVERGIDSALANEIPQLFGLHWGKDSQFMQWFQGLRDNWDALNNMWNQWVLNYDSRSQQALLDYFGWGRYGWQGLAIGLIVGSSLCLLLIMLWLIWSAPRTIADPVQRWYQRFCQELAKRGTVRAPYEGAMTFAEKAALAHPKMADSIQQISQLYIAMRYKSESVEQHFPAFKQAIRELERR